MGRLIAGYRRFRAETWPAERDRYQALARRGQRPETLVVAHLDAQVSARNARPTGTWPPERGGGKA